MSLEWLGINPIMTLYYAAALNGLTALPLIVLVIILANRKYHGPVSQLEGRQCPGVSNCADHNPGRSGADHQHGDRTVTFSKNQFKEAKLSLRCNLLSMKMS
jgi:hypothetical protein